MISLVNINTRYCMLSKKKYIGRWPCIGTPDKVCKNCKERK